MNTKNIISIIIVIAFIGAVGYIFSRSQDPGQVACTMEAKVCPDGSTVGRTGPNCSFAACPTAGQNTNTEQSNVVHYMDPDGEYSFDYSSSFALMDVNKRNSTLDWRQDGTESGYILAKVSAPKSFQPGTNFSESVLTIGRSNTMTLSACTAADAKNGEIAAGKATVSGYPFSKFTSGDAGAGNIYQTTAYRGLVDGDCYSLSYTIHSTNIGNYPPELGIKEFDRAKIVAEMEKTVQSFKSLINSD